MYETVRSQDRYLFQNEWLSAYWHFSFDHYYDPHHVQFEPLRVFNNDTIQPGAGFPTHSTATDFLQDLVVADGFADHAESLLAAFRPDVNLTLWCQPSTNWFTGQMISLNGLEGKINWLIY